MAKCLEGKAGTHAGPLHQGPWKASYASGVIQLYLLVDVCLRRSISFVEFHISLALTQVFDDFLFEVIFRVDISITDQLVYSIATVRL